MGICYALSIPVVMFIIMLVVDLGFPISCITDPAAVGGDVVIPPGTVSLRKYNVLVTKPANTASVYPVTCTSHVVAPDFATHIPITFEFVNVFAKAFITVVPFILTMLPTATDASQVIPSMVLSPEDPPPPPCSFSTILDCIGFDEPLF